MNDHPRNLDADRSITVTAPPEFAGLEHIVHANLTHFDAPRAGAGGPGLAGPDDDPLAALARLIAQPPKVPQIGAAAAEAVRRAAEAAIADIVAVAKSNVDRALELQQQVESYVSTIRQSADHLCAQIEDQTTREYQISMVMRETMARLGPKSGGDQG